MQEVKDDYDMSCKAKIVGAHVGARVRSLDVLQSGKKIFCEIFLGGGATERRERNQRNIFSARQISSSAIRRYQKPQNIIYKTIEQHSDLRETNEIFTGETQSKPTLYPKSE